MTGFDTEQAAQYWKDSGPYLAGPDAVSPDHAVVQELLRDLLPTLGHIDDVVDLGCGRGRIASLLLDVLPSAKYTGVDVGEAQVEATRLVRPDGDFYTSRLQDFEPDRQWDLVIISEVLMHIPPSDIEAVCHKVKGLARKWVVTIDWTAPLGDVPIADWNWLHPYEQMFGPDSVEREIPTGLQSIFVIRP